MRRFVLVPLATAILLVGGISSSGMAAANPCPGPYHAGSAVGNESYDLNQNGQICFINKKGGTKPSIVDDRIVKKH